MKEKKLIEKFNRVDKIEKTMDLIIKEVNNLRNFSVSVPEVSKRMPSYEKAGKKLRQDIDKEQKEKEKENK